MADPREAGNTFAQKVEDIKAQQEFMSGLNLPENLAVELNRLGKTDEEILSMINVDSARLNQVLIGAGLRIAPAEETPIIETSTILAEAIPAPITIHNGDTPSGSKNNAVSERSLPHPEAPRKEEKLAANEKAFLLGFALADHSVVTRADSIVISTRSPDEEKRGKYRLVLGERGQLTDERELKVKLNKSVFGFMSIPRVGPSVLDSKQNFAPFLLGAMFGKLSKKENRISMEDGKILEDVIDQYYYHFDIPLGVSVRSTANGKPIHAVAIKDLPHVIDTLAGVESVASLSKFKEISEALLSRNTPEPRVSDEGIDAKENKTLDANEKAFYTGLAFGDHQKPVIRHHRDRSYVVIQTGSTHGRKRQLWEQTIGKRREDIPTTSKDLILYLESPAFDFMMDPKVDRDFLRNRARFSAFVMGLLSDKLTEKVHHVAHHDAQLLQKVNAAFKVHFGIELGIFRNWRVHNKQVTLLEVKNANLVLEHLRREESVRSLRFFRDIPPMLK